MYIEQDGWTHVVPCDDKGEEPLPSHFASIECPCHPEIEIDEENGVSLIIHNQIN